MDFLEVQMNAATLKEKFNWDDIEVGNNQLDHSQHFFAQKHIKHEKLDEPEEMDLVSKEAASAGLDENISLHETILLDETISNDNSLSSDNKENISAQIPSILVTTEESDNPEIDKNLTNVKKEKNPVDAAEIEVVEKITPDRKKPLSNIAYKWSVQKPVCKSAFRPAQLPAPNAYQYSHRYQRNKEEAMRKVMEEERKMREFHSRPVPNFSMEHVRIERRKVLHAVTVPITPKVLKKSRETDEKRRKKLEELKRKNQPPKFESRSAVVLKEKPFVPQKAATHIQPRPFNLHAEQRSKERKLYDAAVHLALEEKLKQEEEERKKRDEDRVKELRKLATFKARPNPFNKQQKQQ